MQYRFVINSRGVILAEPECGLRREKLLKNLKTLTYLEGE